MHAARAAKGEGEGLHELGSGAGEATAAHSLTFAYPQLSLILLISMPQLPRLFNHRTLPYVFRLQGFWRYFFGDEATGLTYLWNTQKPNRLWNAHLWNLSQTAVLHYTGTKPHVAWSRPAFLRAYRDGKTRQVVGGLCSPLLLCNLLCDSYLLLTSTSLLPPPDSLLPTFTWPPPSSPPPTLPPPISPRSETLPPCHPHPNQASSGNGRSGRR